jgi:solute carrier family 25 protein 39/40
MSTKHTQGQPHDRLQPIGEDGEGISVYNGPSSRTAPEQDTSISQKMLSAVIGSLLTSLLGLSLLQLRNNPLHADMAF